MGWILHRSMSPWLHSRLLWLFAAHLVMAEEKPRILKAPQDVTVEEGRDIQFQCQAGGDPSPNIVWNREKGQVPERRAQVQGDSSLKLTNVRVVDEGMYICRAENSVGFVEALAKLTVHSVPSFMVIPRNKVVGVGRRVSFRCEVLGNPPPAVFWSKETNQVLMFPRQDHGRFSVTDDGTLMIEPVHKEDAGEYMCQALSVAGSAITKAHLEVKGVASSSLNLTGPADGSVSPGPRQSGVTLVVGLTTLLVVTSLV